LPLSVTALIRVKYRVCAQPIRDALENPFESVKERSEGRVLKLNGARLSAAIVVQSTLKHAPEIVTVSTLVTVRALLDKITVATVIFHG